MMPPTATVRLGRLRPGANIYGKHSVRVHGACKALRSSKPVAIHTEMASLGGRHRLVNGSQLPRPPRCSGTPPTPGVGSSGAAFAVSPASAQSGNRLGRPCYLCGYVFHPLSHPRFS